MLHETDVVIVGAGPVGLFQVFELGLQGLQAHVVDALPQPGGQCTELYPDKPIYDIPAIPSCTGQELADNLLQQIKPFDPVFHMDQQVEVLEAQGDQFYLKTSTGTEFKARAVVVAVGGGSFTPVRVRVDGINDFEDSHLFYRVRNPEQFKDQNVVILGGGDSAIDWALALVDDVRHLTIVNRTERFRAAQASVDKLHTLAEQGRADIYLGTTQSFTSENNRLTSIDIKLRDEAGTIKTLPLDSLLVFFGMSPKIGAVEDWGFDFDRKLITVSAATFETSVPGVYAVGDINTYPGKRKLILSGFHEAALAAYAIKERLEPDAKVTVQYTTTSSALQERLGVRPSADSAR